MKAMCRSDWAFRRGFVFCAVLSSLSLAAAIRAQAGALSPVPFPELSWEEGMKRAKAEGRPVFVLLTETAEQDDYWLTNTAKGEAVRKRLADCVRFVGSAAEIRRIETASKAESRRRRMGATFGRYRQCLVPGHQRTRTEGSRWLGRIGVGPERFKARPLMYLLSPEGGVISIVGGSISASRLAFELELALRVAGRGDPESRSEDEAQLEVLRRQLRADKGFDQRMAAQDLAKLPLLAARKLLFELARGREVKNTRVQLYAIRAAGLSGSLLALPKLEPLLRHRNRRIQRAALRSIGELRVPDAIPALVKFAPQTRRGELAEELSRSLLFSQHDHPDVLRLVDAALREKSENIAIAAINAMWECLEHAPKLMATVEELTRERNGAVRDRAAELLRELAKRN
jgi:hypothetical protein